MNHMHVTCTKHCKHSHWTTASLWCLHGRRDKKTCLKGDVSSVQSHITNYDSLWFKVSSFLPADGATLPPNVTRNLEQYSSKAWSNVWRSILLQKTLLFNASLSKLSKFASLKVCKVLLIPFCTTKLLNTNVQPNENRETVSLLKVPLLICEYQWKHTKVSRDRSFLNFLYKADEC